MKKSKYYIIAIILCSIIFGIFGYFVGNKPQKIEKTDTVTVTDTFWKDTTIVEKELVPKYIVKKKVDTVYSKEGDTLQLITEQKRYDRSLVSEKDTCDLQIYTSGINTSLDSLKWRLKTHTVTNTTTITKYIEKKKKFLDKINIGVGVGYGLGLKNKEIEPFIGVTVNYNIW